MWLTYALLSAVFAALTAIFAKIGVANIDSNLATAIRTTVVLIFTWLLVFAGNIRFKPSTIDSRTWLFLILSGLATGLSWIFYFHALQIGTVNKVVPIDKLSLVFTIILAAILLQEKITLNIILGIVLMTAGALIISAAK
jgi:transporter family protein